ncbi:MAG: Wzz/FepE/Etk N-terminal domain-containing protein, partial [Paracoccaceae bacterium]
MNQTTNNYDADDEIDLLELFAALASKWAIIAAFGFIFVTLAGYYAYRVAIPKYESRAVFSMPNSSGSSGGGIADLAGLAGLDLPSGSGSNNVIDRVAGRDFIVELARDLDFLSDPFFNSTLNPPGVRQRLFVALGAGAAEPPTVEALESGLVSEFEKNISIETTEDGAYSITFSHINPGTASVITNAVVDKVLTKSREGQIHEQRLRVEYLSEQLFIAQDNLDNATEKVQEFAVVNNMLSVQELLQRSQQLTKMRERRDDLTSNMAALTKLANFLGAPDSRAGTIEDFLKNNNRLQDREIALLIGSLATRDDWLELEGHTIMGASQNFSDQLA